MPYSQVDFNSDIYREKRYAEGGNSGRGSYGDNAYFKADFINDFMLDNKCRSVIEVGCGDGNNLSLYRIQDYVGLDISESVINKCKEIFAGDDDKFFFVYSGKEIYRADVVLCLDVLLHVFPKKKWEDMIKHCIDMAEKYVIFYTFPKGNAGAKHINDYNFEEYILSLGYKVDRIDKEPPHSQSRFYVLYK